LDLNLYEAMFVMDVQAVPDMAAMEAEINRILGRAEAEIVVCRRWEDRRLAYEIDGRKRGSYWLTYFNAPTDKVVGIERDVQLSEKVLRVLVLRVEEVPKSELEPRPVEAQPAPAEAQPAAPAEAAPAAAAPAEQAPEPVAAEQAPASEGGAA
jgi:small subunit ribosomal protein S6